MTKEKVFSELKDLVKTLSSDNINDSVIYSRWLEKSKRFNERLEGLNSCDILWLNDEWGRYFKEELLPNLSEDQKNEIKGLTDWV